MSHGDIKEAFRAILTNVFKRSIAGSVAPATLYVLDDYVAPDYVD